MTIDANLSQGLEDVVLGESAFPTGLEPFMNKLHTEKRGIGLKTTRRGRAFYYQRDGGTVGGGFGDMRQTFYLGARSQTSPDSTDFSGDPPLNSREATVVNETVVGDKHCIFNSDEAVPNRAHGQPRFIVENYSDQYAPVLAAGVRGGSRIFSAKHLGLGVEDRMKNPDHVKASGNKVYSHGGSPKKHEGETRFFNQEVVELSQNPQVWI